MAVLLCSCGDSVKSGNKVSENPVPLSEALNKSEIWFYGEKPAKDGYFSMAFYFKDGKVTVYQAGGKYSDLNGLSDEAILEYLKEKDKEMFETSKSICIGYVDNKIEEYKRDKEGYEKHYQLIESSSDGVSSEAARIELEKTAEYIKVCEEMLTEYYPKEKGKIERATYAEPEIQEYKLTIQTDDTGNVAENEKIECEKMKYDDEMKRLEDGIIDMDWLIPASSSYQVYDDFYYGFIEYGREESNADFFVTRKELSKAGFTLDGPKTEGIEIW